MSDGSILSSYHHWSGFPEWLGRILRTHYNSYVKAAELIDGGDMSSCWTNMRWTKEGAEEVEEYGAEYYSGKGEDCPPRLDKNLDEYLDCSRGEEYHYLFCNGEWVCYNMHSFDYRKSPELVKFSSAALYV